MGEWSERCMARCPPHLIIVCVPSSARLDRDRDVAARRSRPIGVLVELGLNEAYVGIGLFQWTIEVLEAIRVRA